MNAEIPNLMPALPEIVLAIGALVMVLNRSPAREEIREPDDAIGAGLIAHRLRARCCAPASPK